LAPADCRGHVWGSHALLEISDRAVAIDIAIAADLFAVYFLFVAHAMLLDICAAGRAVVDALLLGGADVHNGIGHQHSDGQRGSGIPSQTGMIRL
jgi:hypothetical protein